MLTDRLNLRYRSSLATIPPVGLSDRVGVRSDDARRASLAIDTARSRGVRNRRCPWSSLEGACTSCRGVYALLTSLTDRLNMRYRSSLATLGATVRQRITALYGETVKSDDLDASFAAFIPQAAGLVQAGQANGVALASGYLETLIAFESGRQANLTALSDTGVVGVNAAGEPLAEAMAAMPSMVKGQIGEGKTVGEALQFGSYLAERFADAELTSAVDLHTEAVVQRSGEFRGWRGVLAGTCDACRTKNGGEHDLDTPVYRHPHCKCSKQFVVEDGSSGLTQAERNEQVHFVADIAMKDKSGNLIPAGQPHTDSMEYTGWGLKRGAVEREAQMRELLAKDGILGGKPAELLAIEGNMAEARSTWSLSWQDGSDNPMSAMAARVLSEDRRVSGAIWSKGQALMEPSPAMRALTNDIYETTQAGLKQDTYKLYRGVGTRDGSGNVIESWTTDPDIAERFDGYAVYEAEVPKERIFLDLSADTEAEMVVMGGGDLPSIRVFSRGDDFVE